MNEESKSVRKKSPWARLLFAAAVVVTLIALFYAEEDWRGWHAWNQFKQECEARGEHLDLASIVPPPVPDEQNFAMTALAFTSYGSVLDRTGQPIPAAQRDTNFIVRMSMPVSLNYDAPAGIRGDRTKGKFTNLEGWQTYYREAAAKTNLFAVPVQPGSPAADVLLALRKYDATIEELRTASRLPESRFPLTYDHESPASILLPHLAPLKSCSQVLQLRSAAELQNAQVDKAFDDLRLNLQLAGKIRTEPFLISHLVRIAILQIALQTLWEGLAQHKWSDAQLTTFDADLARLDFPADFVLGMRGELGMEVAEISRLRRHPEQLAQFGGFYDDQGNGGGGGVTSRLIARSFPAGWFYQNQYRCTRMMVDFYLPAAEVAEGTFSPAITRSGEAALRADTKHASPYNLIERMMLPALVSASRRFAHAQASVNLARTAMALERYRLVHNEYPESTEALAPQFIARLPHDVIGGQPLKYRRESNGDFVLYSVGWNETDDGGVQVFEKGSTPKVDLNQGDWVWQYPPK